MIQEINAALALFYPISVLGIEQPNLSGYGLWAKVIENKIEQLQDNNFVFASLVRDIESIEGVQHFIGHPAMQFPSYSLCFGISHLQVDGFLHQRSLWIDISLLGNFVTFFIEDTVSCNQVSEAVGGMAILPTYYLFNRAAKMRSLVELLQNVGNAIKRHLPEHIFIPIDGLFEPKYHFRLYHKDLNISPSLFDILFSDRYHTSPSSLRAFY